MKSYFFKKISVYTIISVSTVLLTLTLSASTAFAIEIYTPGETILIGEFIYNDDYTPTTDDCTLSVYSPVGVLLVNEVTMTDDATGWHRYSYTTPATEGKYPAFITCGSLVGGDLLKLDKSFILKNPPVTATDVTSAVAPLATSAQLTSATSPLATAAMLTLVKTKTDTIDWTDVTTIKNNVATLITEIGTGNIAGIKTKTDSIVWSDVTGIVTDTGDIKAKTDTIAWADVTGIKTKTDTIAWADVTGIKTKTDTILWTDIAALATSSQLTAAVSPLATSAGVTAATGTITSAIAALNNISAADVWSSPTRSLTTYGTLVADIWANSSRTLTSGGSLTASDVWSYGTRNLTDGTLTSGSLATLANLSGLATAADVTSAVAPLATSAQLTSATSPLATAAMLTLVKTKTDTIDWTDVTTIKNNVATLITEIGTGNIAGIKTKTDSIVWSDVTGIVTNTGDIKAKTDTIAWADVTGIKTKTDTIAWADVTGIKTKTDTILWTDIAALATSSQLTAAVSPLATSAGVTAATGTITSAIAALPADVWAYTSRTVTSLGSLVTDVWNAATRTLTSQTSWGVSVSNFGTITAGSNYLATVNTIYNGTVTDSMVVPTVTIYDPSRNVIVNGASMTRTSTGTYTYVYATPLNAPDGTWETVFSANVESGKTLPGNDYWTVVTTPAQVIVNSMGSVTTPTVSANITITNEGLSGYEYQYEWCVVTAPDNVCGGGDDVFNAVAAKFINPSEDFNTTLTATVPSAGNYYFKVIAYFGMDSSVASRSFTAVAGSAPSGGGGGGGGGGTSTPSKAKGTCGKIADFNCDQKINSIDFSILLYFWKSKPPFKNEYVDINKDDKIDSVDFSILLYRWEK